MDTQTGQTTLIIKKITVGLLEENCYLLGCEETRAAILIDPGDSARSILQQVEEDGLELQAIVNTHAHFDHVLAVNDIVDATGVPFWLHELDLPTLQAVPAHVEAWLGARVPPVRHPDHYLKEGRTLEFGTMRLQVRFVPGHAPGHVAFVEEERRLAIVGDTLFHRGIGRFDLPGADGPTLLASITDQLLTLEDDFVVLPGHGPETTIGEERVQNPYVGEHATFVI